MVTRPRRRRSKSMDLASSKHSIDSSYSIRPTTSARRGHASRRKKPLKKVSSGVGNALRSMLTSSRTNHQQQVEEKKNTELNIFCSDVIVSTEFTLSRMEYAVKTPTIVKLEFEDLLERPDQTLFLEVLDVMIADRRPWKYFRFVDHLYNAEQYDRYLRLKKDLWRLLKDDAVKRHIPIQFQATMEIARGSTNGQVIAFLERLDTCGDCADHDIQSVEFAGALFGYRPRRIPTEMEGLCKHGYLRETIVLKVSYRAPEVGDPVAILAEQCSFSSLGSWEGVGGSEEVGDNTVTMEKARTLQVIATCIDRLREAANKADGGGEPNETVVGGGGQKGKPDNNKRAGLSRTVSDVSHLKDRHQRGANKYSFPSDARVRSLQTRRQRRLRRTSTTGDIKQHRKGNSEADMRLSDSDSSHRSRSSNKSHIDDGALGKLSAVRKGMQKSIQQLGRLENSQRGQEDDPPQSNAHNDTNTGNKRIPRSSRIRRSLSIDGSVTRTRIQLSPGPAGVLQRSSTYNPSSKTNVPAQVLAAASPGSIRRARRRPPRRHKSVDSSLPVALPTRTPRSTRRPVHKANSNRRIAVVLGDDEALDALELGTLIAWENSLESKGVADENLDIANRGTAEQASGWLKPEGGGDHFDISSENQDIGTRKDAEGRESDEFNSTMSSRKGNHDDTLNKNQDSMCKKASVGPEDRSKETVTSHRRRENESDNPSKQSSATASLVNPADALDQLTNSINPQSDKPSKKSSGDVTFAIRAKPDALDQSANSVDILEAIMHEDISRVDLYESVQALGHNSSSNRSIMELFGKDTMDQSTPLRLRVDTKGPSQKELAGNETEDASKPLGADTEEKSQNSGSSHGILEQIMQKSLDLSAKVAPQVHDHNRSIMELFGEKGLVEKPKVDLDDDASILTIDSSGTNASFDLSARVDYILHPSSNSKKNKKKKRSKDKSVKRLNRSMSNLERTSGSSPARPRRRKKKDLVQGEVPPSLNLTGPLALFCTSMSALETSDLGGSSTGSNGEESDHFVREEGPDFDWETNTILTF